MKYKIYELDTPHYFTNQSNIEFKIQFFCKYLLEKKVKSKIYYRRLYNNADIAENEHLKNLTPTTFAN